MTNPNDRHRRAVITALAVSLPFAFLTPAGASTAAPTAPSPDQQAAAPSPSAHLDLGAQDLPETRNVATLAPGLTRTTISRGAPNQDFFWTAEVAVPSTSPDPDAPASALSIQAQAQMVADKLAAAGVTARVEHVQSPQLADAGGDLGYRVRVGEFGAKADGSATLNQIKAAGYKASVIYTGWDGDAGTSENDRGPWNLQVLTIDPKEFRGDLTSSFGPNLEDRETTSQLSAAAGALAAVNGGFFTMDPAAGAPGDPAGAAVHNGKVLSEPVGDRPSLVLDKNGTSIQRLHWHGTVSAPSSAEQPLDGMNRVPGLIRNCGGTNDTPTNLPLHDFTCTDADEIVAFTPEFGPTTPAGPGLEVVLDGQGTVTAVNHTRGTAVPADGQTVQAIGSDVDKLAALSVPGKKLKVNTDLLDEDGKALKAGPGTDVVNGGPTLVQSGQLNITAKRDGMVRANDNNSFFYGWVHKRNPRTIAGVDAQGRTLLVTADGRQTTSLGLSIKESADVARSLGMVNAINLDGGGSTTMVQGGQVVNSPSDATGERPVGDALLLLAGR